MHSILQFARVPLHPLCVIAVLCIPARLSAEDNVPTPPPRIVLEPCYLLPLPPMAHLLAYGDVALRATKPPTLEEHLAAANQRLQQKTAAAMPLIDAVRKAEAELAPAQNAHAAAQQQAATLQKNMAALAAEIKQINDSRTANDAERTKVAASLAQVQGAQPLVAEALRHLTEAVGKAPTDTALTDAQRQLTEKLKAMETNVTELQAKSDELTAAIGAADAKLKETNSRLDAARQESAALADRIAALQSQSQQLAAVVDAARKASEPAQSEVAQAMREVERWQHEIAFRDQMAALEAELADARELAAARQSELDKASEQLSAAESAVNSATAQRDQASRTVEAINAKIQAARAAK